ncbi:hypothetical protein IscW_ISCW012127 [Ixodes scapularis]|uniref:Uncharacterized protein n=1 Tax=Ixodes scapularis TaxID=6945 RepID=B7QAI6_IXOSC|nr:hypothetical protein IscW_ISCW012127 [Ixodes scapularis]|eukprot:XP_002412562.1 hypothetical protein IscW_ISCW012127 [Ixodes scapularis]
MGQSLPRFESPKTTADFLALSFPWLSRLHCDILRFFRNVYSTVYFSVPVCLFFLAPPPVCFLPTAPRVGACNDCHEFGGLLRDPRVSLCTVPSITRAMILRGDKARL